MTRRRLGPDERLDELQSEVAGLNQKLSACHPRAAAARRELQEMPARLVAARAAAERGRDDPDAGVVGARELELRGILAEAEAQVAGLEAALREVAADIRGHYAAHTGHYTSLAHQASEAAVAAWKDLRSAVDRLEAARNRAQAAWSVVGAGNLPGGDNLGAVRHYAAQAIAEPYPRGVQPRGAREDEPAAA